MYYLRCHHTSETIDCEKFKYTLYLLDHNVNNVELDETQAILINRDNYEIIKLTNTIDETINNEEQEQKTDILSDNFEDEFDKLE